MGKFKFDKPLMKKIVTKAAIAFGIIFVSMTGAALAAHSFTTSGSEISASIRKNNRTSKYGETYWGIEIKKDDLAWASDSYAYALQAFAGSWSSEVDVPTNYAVVINNSLDEVFISNGVDAPLGVKVIGDPYRNTISKFGFKLRNGTTFDSYHKWYCSDKVAAYLGNKMDAKLNVAFNKKGVVSDITFSDVVESFEHKLLNDIIGDAPYIVVPHEGEGFSGYTSFDNINITGRTRFLFAFKSDKYQNEFSLNRVNYFVHREKFNTNYTASFIENADDVMKSMALIKSPTQAIYNYYGNDMNVFAFRPVFFSVGILLVALSVIAVLLAFKFNWFGDIHRIVNYAFFTSLLALLIYWIVGQILYAYGSPFAIWSPVNRMITVFWTIDLACIISLIAFIIIYKERRDEEKKAYELVKNSDLVKQIQEQERIKNNSPVAEIKPSKSASSKTKKSLSKKGSKK